MLETGKSRANDMKCVPLHIGISVADIEKSRDWYREKLGFELLSQTYAAPLKCKVAFLGNGNFEIELFQHDDTIALPKERLHPNTDIQTQGTKHICFTNDNVPELVEGLKNKGVDIVMGPLNMGTDVVAYIRDNNGTLIEFIQKK
jgi:methylmalonyl-CoA/ethylmalonyl-CoA epimerase